MQLKGIRVIGKLTENPRYSRHETPNNKLSRRDEGINAGNIPTMHTVGTPGIPQLIRPLGGVIR